jgi:DNA-binding transcriptional ArsR family regulator
MFTYRDLDPILRALADPTRRYVFERLCGEEWETVSHLSEPLPLSRQAVLHHLAVLERCGVIHTEKRDKTRWCFIEPRALDLLEHWLHQQRIYFERRHMRGCALPRVVDPEIAQLLSVPFSSRKSARK